MMHKRMLNECSEQLARCALSILTSQQNEKDASRLFVEFARVFQEVLVDYEVKRERMLARLGRPNEVAEEAHQG